MTRALLLVGALAAAGCNDRCLIEGANCASLDDGPKPYTRIAAGFTHTCAATDYRLVCWGEDQDGSTEPPVGAPLGLDAGRGFTCAHTDRNVYCWGREDVVSSTPTSAAFLDVLAVGENHACAGSTNSALSTGTICWGDNSYGQAASRSQMTLLAAGTKHTCGLGTDNAVHCWGANDDGQAPMTETGLGVVALAAGAQYTCSLASNGSVRCWGAGPVISAPAVPFRSISGGTSHVCGVTTPGRSVICWGDNTYGQASPPPGVYEDVSAGDRHTCAVDDSGVAICWGDDTYGQASPP